jgi:glycosyltransferase involved in cell wall biosynthesis
LSDFEPNLKVSVAPNALYRADYMRPAKAERLDSFLWIGRLVPDKKPELAIKAFALAAPALAGVRLRIVGAGPSIIECQQLAELLGIEERCEFLGWIDDGRELSSLFGSAIANVSSGYVGLNVTQSLGFGCPVIYPDADAHAPEVCLLTAENSLEFESDSEQSLASALIELNQRQHEYQRQSISDDVRQTYSAERMANNFLSALESL